ncbi:MAG: metal ABC transporter ATP-binding protein [Patescibacteria group bacterium]|jgi:ABC-type Mn2+/Zn2+ transport system ATPase subunit
MDAVSVKNLKIRYGSHVVLNGLNFEIEKGNIAAVIGPNGSGKTTLFKALLGLIPYEGEIKIFQKSIKNALKRIAYVPQHFDFDRTLPITVDEFLSFASNGKSINAKEICREVSVDILAEKLIGDLSGGQLQRVLIAQALIKDPDLLFLDEPSAGIDIEGSKAFYDLIKHINKEHDVTILLISHEMSMVSDLADQILCLNRDLVCNGPPREVLTKKVLDKLYGPEMNIREHKHL